MSYPSQKRLRRSRGLAAVVAALMAAGAGLATSPAAQAAFWSVADELLDELNKG